MFDPLGSETPSLQTNRVGLEGASLSIGAGVLEEAAGEVRG